MTTRAWQTFTGPAATFAGGSTCAAQPYVVSASDPNSAAIRLE
jgi:hypothetical protein